MRTNLKMKPSFLAVLAIFLMGIAPSFAQTSSAPTGNVSTATPPMEEARAVADVKAAMRVLWEDHITYTRSYIVSALADLGDVEEISQRLLRNQDDLGNAIQPYYGNEAGEKLSTLLREHIVIATKVVAAAKAGNKQQLAAAQERWSSNAKEIASFLSGANPNWSRSDVEVMLQKHLDLTTREVTARLKKDWKADILAYDEGHRHMLMFSDMLVEGIAKQYPAKFAQ